MTIRSGLLTGICVVTATLAASAAAANPYSKGSGNQNSGAGQSGTVGNVFQNYKPAKKKRAIPTNPQQNNSKKKSENKNQN